MNKIAHLAAVFVNVAGLGLFSIQASAQTILPSQLNPAQISVGVMVWSR